MAKEIKPDSTNLLVWVSNYQYFGKKENKAHFMNSKGVTRKVYVTVDLALSTKKEIKIQKVREMEQKHTD